MSTRGEKERREIRYASTVERLDQHESGFKPTAVRPPEGTKMFKFRREGIYEVDVIPYWTKGKNPYCKTPGMAYWELTFQAHRGIGVDSSDYCCSRLEFGEDCPVCELVTRLRSDPNTKKETINEFREKERQLFLFRVRNSPDPSEIGKDIRLYETGHFKSFGETLETELDFYRKTDPNHPILQFFRLDEKGFTLQVLVKEEVWERGKFLKPVKINFVPRLKGLPERLIDEAPCLEDLRIHTPYEEYSQILLSGKSKSGVAIAPTNGVASAPPRSAAPAGYDDDDEDDAPPAKPLPKAAASYDDDDEDTPPAKPAKKAKAPVAEDDDDEDDTPRPTSARAAGSKVATAAASRSDPDDDEDDDDDDEGVTPTPPKAGKKPTPVAVEPDDDDDDEPVAPPAKKAKKAMTAAEKGLKVAYKVDHPEHGRCTVVHISADGTSLKLRDAEGNEHRAVQPSEVELAKAPAKAPAAVQEKPGRKAPPPPPDDDDDDDEVSPAAEDDDDDDDEPAPPPKAKKAAKR
jgi:hypothetical protein